jgi:anti-sigma regulatory factor (Ser/Thr protein kinase)
VKGTTAKSASWALPPVARSVVEARHHVRVILNDWNLTALCDAALLLTSEVVTNSLLHARSPIRLTIEQTRSGVRVSVADESTVLPAMRPRSQSATTGRGLLLLSRIADQWDTEVTDAGKTVWFTLSGGRDPWAGVRDVDARDEADS